MALFDGFATTSDWARGSYVSRDEDDGRNDAASRPYTDRAQQSSAAFSRLSAVDEEELIAACTGAQPPTKTRLPREELEALDQKVAQVGSGSEEDFIHHLDRLIKKYKIKLPCIQVRGDSRSVHSNHGPSAGLP